VALEQEPHKSCHMHSNVLYPPARTLPSQGCDVSPRLRARAVGSVSPHGGRPARHGTLAAGSTMQSGPCKIVAHVSRGSSPVRSLAGSVRIPKPSLAGSARAPCSPSNSAHTPHSPLRSRAQSPCSSPRATGLHSKGQSVVSLSRLALRQVSEPSSPCQVPRNLFGTYFPGCVEDDGLKSKTALPSCCSSQASTRCPTPGSWLALPPLQHRGRVLADQGGATSAQPGCGKSTADARFILHQTDSVPLVKGNVPEGTESKESAHTRFNLHQPDTVPLVKGVGSEGTKSKEITHARFDLVPAQLALAFRHENPKGMAQTRFTRQPMHQSIQRLASLASEGPESKETAAHLSPRQLEALIVENRKLREQLSRRRIECANEKTKARMLFQHLENMMSKTHELEDMILRDDRSMACDTLQSSATAPCGRPHTSCSDARPAES